MEKGLDILALVFVMALAFVALFVGLAAMGSSESMLAFVAGCGVCAGALIYFGALVIAAVTSYTKQ